LKIWCILIAKLQKIPHAAMGYADKHKLSPDKLEIELAASRFFASTG
jgi:hypothetical protein